MRLGPGSRWALIPVAAIAGCTGTTVIVDGAGDLLRFVVTPAALEAALPLDWRYGIVNAAAAIAFVVLGSWMGPRHRVVVAFALYAAGALAAWLALDHWFFPENHPRAYQISHVPLVLALIGGAIGVAIRVGIGTRPAPEIR